jgi:hypothetical protein
MQRKQMLAEMLMGNAQQANQTPANWDSMRLVPRRGALQNLSALLAPALAGKAMKKAQGAQNQYFQGLYGGGGQGNQQPQGAPNSPAGPYAGGLDQPPPQTSGLMTPQGGGSNLMIPQGMGRGQAAGLMGMMGPSEYAKTFVAPNFKPAAIRANIRAAGIDPDSAQGKRMALAALQKSTTNVQDVRPGGTIFDVNAKQPIFSAPKDGVQTQWGPQGPAASLIPGAQELAARQEGLDTAQKVSNTPQTLPTAGGGSKIGYPGDMLGPPPALRDQPGPSAGPKNYFPPSQQTPVPQEGPWASMPKLPVSGALGAPDAFTHGRLQEAGKKDAELSSQYGKEADLADQKQQYNSEALKVLPQAETGPMSEWLTENKARLLELGVPSSLIPSDGKVTPTMELNKFLKNAALQGARQIYGARMTQMEVKLQTDEMSPSAHMTGEAIRSLVQQDNIKNAYAKQRSDDYGKYIAQKGDPLRFESWYAKHFPLTQFAKGQAAIAPTPGGSPAKGTPNPGDIVKGYRFKGGDPSKQESWEKS